MSQHARAGGNNPRFARPPGLRGRAPQAALFGGLSGVMDEDYKMNPEMIAITTTAPPTPISAISLDP